MALNENEFLKPVEVQHEFGLKVRMLSYFRECSMDEGKLRGPNFLKDGEVVLYKREWIVNYIAEKQPFCIATSNVLDFILVLNQFFFTQLLTDSYKFAQSYLVTHTYNVYIFKYICIVENYLT